MRSLKQAINDAQLVASARVRVYRNVLIAATLVLLLAVVLLPLAPLAPWVAGGLAVIRTDTSLTPLPLRPSDLATVEMWGFVGALVAVIVALRNLSSVRHPSGLQLAQLLLKLPAGAITAVFGVVLLQADIVPPLKPVSVSKLAAYAVLFGFAQEAVTALVDRQANRLLEQTKPISDKTP